MGMQAGADLSAMRRSGRLNARAQCAAADALIAGRTTADVAHVIAAEIDKGGGKASFLDTGYPAVACISVNDEVGHAPPGERRLLAGDVVKVDIGVCCAGYHTDAAVTHVVGAPSGQRAHTPLHRAPFHSAAVLVEVTRDALRAGVVALRPGRRLSDVSAAIGQCASASGCGVVRQAFGHGIGQSLHEEPALANFGPDGFGPRAAESLAVAIEPVFTAGSRFTRKLADGWTDATVDGCLSAHFEHTVFLHAWGPEVLTASNSGTEAQYWVNATRTEFAAGDCRVYLRSASQADESAVGNLVARQMDDILIRAWGRRAQMDDVWRDGDGVVVVESAAGGIVGCFVTSIVEDRLHLDTLVVDGAHQSRGVGRHVLRLLENECKSLRLRAVSLCVQTTNPRAQSLYRRVGYRVVGSPYVNTVCMEKVTDGSFGPRFN